MLARQEVRRREAGFLVKALSKMTLAKPRRFGNLGDGKRLADVTVQPLDCPLHFDRKRRRLDPGQRAIVIADQSDHQFMKDGTCDDRAVRLGMTVLQEQPPKAITQLWRSAEGPQCDLLVRL